MKEMISAECLTNSHVFDMSSVMRLIVFFSLNRSLLLRIKKKYSGVMTISHHCPRKLPFLWLNSPSSALPRTLQVPRLDLTQWVHRYQNCSPLLGPSHILQYTTEQPPHRRPREIPMSVQSARYPWNGVLFNQLQSRFTTLNPFLVLCRLLAPLHYQHEPINLFWPCFQKLIPPQP